MLRLGQELGIGVVATNDAHYLRREDAEAHDVLLAIGTGSDLDDPKRFRFIGQESYVKSEAEMRALFPDQPETPRQHAPGSPTSASSISRSVLPARLSPPRRVRERRGAARSIWPRRAPSERYGIAAARGSAGAAGLRARRHHEDAGYAGYFLIVHDFIKAARDRGHPGGPGPRLGRRLARRLLAAASPTSVPLKFDLLFERFLNPERVSMPDIDVDFCFERRGEVIEYVRRTYGRDSVGQIVTFGTMKSRAAIKDVGRVLGFRPARPTRSRS